MAKKLPLLISVPHGGRKTPEELKGTVALTPEEILDDADAFTDALYDVGEIVAKILIAEIARPFVDLNRSERQMPPEAPDGLIKSRTSYDVPVYREGRQPDEAMIRTLISRYYEPYHSELANHLASDEVMLMLDCHSMAEYPPPIAPDSEKRRPLINLGNLEGRSCPDETLNSLAVSFARSFDLDEDEISLNHPFKGGFITQRYGKNPKPVVQVELNRVIYFDPQDPHRENNQRIGEVRTSFMDTISLFHDMITTGN